MISKRQPVKEIGLWVSDGNKAMLNAIAAKFGTTPRQRCVMHKMDNVLSYIPTKQQEQIKPELRALFYQQDGSPLIRLWQPSSRNTRGSIPLRSSACSAIWRRV